MNTYKWRGRTFRAWSEMQCSKAFWLLGISLEEHMPHTWDGEYTIYGPYMCWGYPDKRKVGAGDMKLPPIPVTVFEACPGCGKEIKGMIQYEGDQPAGVAVTSGEIVIGLKPVGLRVEHDCIPKVMRERGTILHEGED